ncbi:glycosyltransferase family 2 protein [Hazenella sp. IB182357]|uniref:Glycosyltransferase family 2 protein n=1 Tax=Polycladospora coralii TaxID=2771432 RepID=A0A926N7M5_9BACL|nr:glycosyltransferase family A protein [Polycladospora coralii]MBD1371152.1 glycosyltransferase family 2 protein [Polycladospora coralii]MBS7530094.1 glycosyltransferase family 2 protein [Polycladospora coralii]
MNTGFSVICVTNKDHTLQNIMDNFVRQDYWNKELIVVLNDDHMDENHWRHTSSRFGDVSIFKLPQHTTLGTCLNFAIDRRKFHYIARMDDDDFYGYNYLQNTMKTFQEHHADVVARQDFFMYVADKQTLHIRHTSDHMIGGSIAFHERILSAVRFHDVSQAEDNRFYEDAHRCGFNVQMPSHYNDFVYIRNSPNNKHTWQPDEESLYYSTKYVTHTDYFYQYLS